MFRVQVDYLTRTAIVPPDLPESPTEQSGGSAESGVHSPNVRWREPTPEEHALALTLSRTLQDPGDPPRREVDRHVAPPGRLVTSQAVQGTASRALGVPDFSRPWARPRRTRRNVRPLRLGVLTDISGSQRDMVDLSCSLTWILSTAGRDEGVDVLSLLFGSDITSVAVPGTSTRGVPEPVRLSDTERFGEAADLLHRGLDLDDRGTDRVVVVFSDGGFTDEESDETKRRLLTWARQGVSVLWYSDVRDRPDHVPLTARFRWINPSGSARVDVISDVLVETERDRSG